MFSKKATNLLTQILSYLFPHLVEQREGKLTKYIEVVFSNGKMLMNSTKANYSFGALHTVFLKSFKKLNINSKKINSILILGFGGGSIVAMLNENFNINTKTIAVEADEVVIDLAKKYFNLEKYKNLSLVHTDAFDYVLNCTEQFDLIAIDIFIDTITPEKFSSSVFIKALNKLMNSNTLVCYNRMIIDEKTKEEVQKIIKLLPDTQYKKQLLEYNFGNSSTNVMIAFESCK